jgi:AraC-like DNA-binding protein
VPLTAVPLAFWTANPVCADGGSAARGREDVIEIAKVFIEQNLGKPIDVTRIAREVELTRRGFTRVFREAEGVSPWDFVLARKIRRAEELLGRGVPLSEVADELGFCDQSHFTRVFKRRTGETPGEYRKRTKVQDREGDAA